MGSLLNSTELGLNGENCKNILKTHFYLNNFNTFLYIKVTEEQRDILKALSKLSEEERKKLLESLSEEDREALLGLQKDYEK